MLFEFVVFVNKDKPDILVVVEGINGKMNLESSLRSGTNERALGNILAIVAN